jgi:transcriptional regulator with XRE-family HTH domain
MRTRIKELRLEKNLTQQALAEQLGINQAALSKLECELSTPDASLLVNLSRFFHVSTDYILFLSEERLNADHLLADNMYHLKKYQHLLAAYQKMDYKQQGACYNFLCSMLNIDSDL